MFKFQIMIAAILLLSAVPCNKKASVSFRTQRARLFRGTTSFLPFRKEPASGYFHILCAVSGAPGFPTTRTGFRSQLRRVFQVNRPGCLTPPGSSLCGISVPLLDLHHCTAIVLRNLASVKSPPLKKQQTNNQPFRRPVPARVFPPARRSGRSLPEALRC